MSERTEHVLLWTTVLTFTAVMAIVISPWFVLIPIALHPTYDKKGQ